MAVAASDPPRRWTIGFRPSFSTRVRGTRPARGRLLRSSDRAEPGDRNGDAPIVREAHFALSSPDASSVAIAIVREPETRLREAIVRPAPTLCAS
jgi:hypothetical protein